MTHAQALDWLYAQTRAGGRRHPGRAARLLAALRLEPPPNVVRVVGTNGKGTVSPERISAVEPPEDGRALLAYVFEGWPSKLGLVRGTREQRLTSVGDDTRYDTVEIFSGPLVPLAGPGRVAEGFRRHAEALKARAESQARPGG